MTDICACNKYEMRKACLKYDECMVTGKLRDLFQKQSEENKIFLVYDVELDVYRMPRIVDRSKFTVLNAYCEIKKHD